MNRLTHEQQALVIKVRERMANELRVWILTPEAKQIRATKKEDLIKFHHTLGRAIRNEFELWVPEHEITSIWKQAEAETCKICAGVGYIHRVSGTHTCPECSTSKGLEMKLSDSQTEEIEGSISADVDDHPCHPDNFSFSVIERLWEMYQERKVESL